jgi:hypothetical protein
MYRFMDRPVSSLAPGHQILVWSMRGWVAAMALQRCPCAALGASFERWRVADLLSDFNMTMCLLNGEAQGHLHFCRPDCGTIRDDEAMLLALFDAAASDDYRRLQRIAAQIVKPEAVSPLIAAASGAADVLRRTPVPRTN